MENKQTKATELKELKEVLIATNEHDVEIAKLEKELATLTVNFGAEFRKLELEKEHETKRFNAIVKSTETVLLGGMILAGYVVATTKRYEANKYAVEYGTVVE